MNAAIKRIKNSALATASAFEKKEKVILDTEQDEIDTAVYMMRHGYGDLKETFRRNKYCRWDIEGEGIKVEVKSRTYTKPEWTTWVIDTYKIDKLIEKFPDEDIYFVNVFENEFHLYDAKYVAECKVVKKQARFRDGTGGLRTYYEIPKDGYIMELKTGKKNEKI